MVAGGRELMFGDDLASVLDAGANSIVIGNYLTTKGGAMSKDLEMLQSLGVSIASHVE
jgi:biotin synthase